MKQRFIGNNVRLVEDIIEYADKFDTDGILLFLDFKKAFDSLEWNFMVKALKFFNFGDIFIRWVEVLYKDSSLCIKNNGYLSDSFSVSRGIKQGCPLSALLFIIAVEIMALKMKSCKELKGYVIKHGDTEREVKICQYADDGILFLKNARQICLAINLIEEFGKHTGLNLNLKKTTGMYLGVNKLKEGNMNEIIITNKPLKCLGIYVGYDKIKCAELN